jgi:deoxyribonuclease-4
MAHILVGSHVPRQNAATEAELRGAAALQIHTSAPRNWAAPIPRGDENALAASPTPVFVHAPYLINPAASNPELRTRSRACLEAEAAAADILGAVGLVVHAGHPTGGGGVGDAVARWVATLDGLTLPCRILVENTASGVNSPGRSADTLTALVQALREAGHDVGVTFDTCHAWAAGQDPVSMAERLADTVGIDLVHANNSRDPFGSGRDRHANLTSGTIPTGTLIAAVAAAEAPAAVVETPGGSAAQTADVNWLRRHLNPQH